MTFGVLVDLNPFVDQVVLPAFAPILLAVLTLAIAKVAALFHVPLDNHSAEVIDGALSTAIAALERSPGKISGVEATGSFAATLEYLNTTVPGAIKQLGVSPAQLGALVAARLAPLTMPPPSPPSAA
jgi:hypothetical protein